MTGWRLGVGVAVVRAGRVLVGQRLARHGVGHWAFPGGHLEEGESPLQCAVRELKEETGLELLEPRLFAVTHDLYPEGPQYLTLFVSGTVAGDQEPTLMEPEKCAGWYWFSWDAIPQPRFLSLQNLLASDFPLPQ